MLNKDKFFSGYKKQFNEKLTQSQVDGINFLLDKFSLEKDLSLDEVAYMFATVKHECANTYQPITEYGGIKYFDKYDTGKLAKQLGNTPEKDGDGFKFRGRGFVQITGYYNYNKFSIILTTNLVDDPDLVLDPDIAFRIMVYGMKNGTFTGKKFSDFKVPTGLYFTGCRKIINGQDEASLIAGYATKFLKILKSSVE